ncbi:MAG: CAP domain-containing protein [Pseudomonadota bacterium]
MVTALALAALVPMAAAESGKPSMAASCELSDGYGVGVEAFAQEAEACLSEPLPEALETAAKDLLTLADRSRAKAGLAPLERRTSLDRAARAHALDMAANGYAAHGDRHGRTHSERVQIMDRTGIYGTMGANVIVVEAGTDAVRLYGLLMSDPVNSDNMLRKTFTHGGIGFAEADGKLFVTQLFGRLDGELSEPLPIGLPPIADVDVTFTDENLAFTEWRLEDAEGRRVRRGTFKAMKRSGGETGDLALIVEADTGGALYALSGPAMSAGT